MLLTLTRKLVRMMATVLIVETRGRTWRIQAWYMQIIPPKYLDRGS